MFHQPVFLIKLPKKNKEVYIRKYNSSLYGMSEHGKIVSGESPNKQSTPWKNKEKSTLDTSIKVE